MKITYDQAIVIRNQSQKVIDLIVEAQGQLQRIDVLHYFRANPGDEIPLLENAQKSIKSFYLVMKGLKERLGSTVLDSIVSPDHEVGWLNVGDIFVGWVGFCNDRPFIVTSKDKDNKYKWRYLDDNESVSYPPMLNDPGLLHGGWMRVSVDSEDISSAILSFQQFEIEALQKQISYFQNNKFII